MKVKLTKVPDSCLRCEHVDEEFNCKLKHCVEKEPTMTSENNPIKSKVNSELYKIGIKLKDKSLSEKDRKYLIKKRSALWSLKNKLSHEFRHQREYENSIAEISGIEGGYSYDN